MRYPLFVVLFLLLLIPDNHTVLPMARPTRTATPMLTRTATPTVTQTRTPTATRTATAARTATATRTATAIQTPPDQIWKGLAQAMNIPADRELLGVTWYYDWSWCVETGCVPMSYYGDLLSACVPVALVFNEPNAIPPWGGPVDPTEAARRVRAIEVQCPATRLVVGNVSVDDWRPAGGWGNGYWWLWYFLGEYQTQTGQVFSGALAAHCYERQNDYCFGQLTLAHTVCPNCEFWITELARLDANAYQFGRMLSQLRPRFARIAIYTNRQPPPPCDWCLPWPVALVANDGTLTALGQLYADEK